MIKLNSRGMSLIEVVMALMILAGGLLLISQSWSGTFGRLRKTQSNVIAAALLQRKITELEMEFKGKPLDSIPEEKGDDFGSEYPDYSWTMTSKNFEMPDMTGTLMGKEGGSQTMELQIMKQFTDQLSKSIKEMRVTIVYKTKKGKEIKYSITTYIVDYDKDIPIPGLPGGDGTGASPNTGTTPSGGA